MIQFEQEILRYLDLPKIPVKKWDGKTSFQKGVAVLQLRDEKEAYAICSFDAESGSSKPNIVKVFGIEPFIDIKEVLVVPSYMSTEEDIKDMDLDEQSKKRVKEVLKEAREIENEGTEDEDPMSKLPEYIFPEIENKEQAIAWLKNYNYRNKIKKGKIPSTDENIKLRLYSIYTELQKKQK